MGEQKRFKSPFEMPTLPGTEGWERMYHYSWQFSEERREQEENLFWFWDSMHFPEPMYPFESYVEQVCLIALNAVPTRVFKFPFSNGAESRLVNGYYYGAFRSIDPEEAQRRGPIFGKRIGFYYQNWNELYEKKWIPKMKFLIEELKQIKFVQLPESESDSMALEGKEDLSGYVLMNNFRKLQESLQKTWQYHWEFLPLVYLAYLGFYEVCAKLFPGIKYATIGKMVTGHKDLLMYRPDEELCKLSRSAMELGVKDVFKPEMPPDEIIARLKATDSGKKWLQDFETAKDPWFYVSTGSGFSPVSPRWIEDLSIPFGYIRGYLDQLEKGKSIERPVGQLANERDRIVKEYRDLIKNEEDKAAFDQSYQTLLMTFPYAENHIFFVEHWYHTIFWQKVRELGGVLVSKSFLNQPSDIFYFNEVDVMKMLMDYSLNWSVGSGPSFPSRGLTYWPKELKWRKEVMETFRTWTPPPALGVCPEEIRDPAVIHLWGITTETLNSWLMAENATQEEAKQLKGFPASSGVVTGPARVILSIQDLGALQPGEILVCALTSPSWGPVFGKIKAVVTDIGGMSSHASIVAREYGIPAVVATGYATKMIRTGDMIEVDGGEGVVKILK